MFSNLIENAIKHSPPDVPVTITAGVGSGRVTVRVIDRGRGIPAADRTRVFEPFFRGRRDTGSGSGLGLAICRGFVEANGGQIVLQSARGPGTSFAVSFPLVKQPEAVDVNAPRVLVVDDEPQIVRGLKIILRGAGYAVEAAETKADALAALAARPPDALVLDLVLPDGQGVDVCREVRTWSRLPIVVLSAVGDEREKVRALDAGADDYITKPFGTDELLARLRAVLRRSGDGGGSPVIEVGELVIDLTDRSVSRGGEPIHLTRIEFELLRVLAQHHGRLVTHRQLLQEVWGPEYGDETHYLRVHVAHIRSKLEPDPSRPTYVITEPGVGYRLRDPEN